MPSGSRPARQQPQQTTPGRHTRAHAHGRSWQQARPRTTAPGPPIIRAQLQQTTPGRHTRAHAHGRSWQQARPRTTAPARRSSAPSSSRSHGRTHTHTPAGQARRSPAQAPQPPHRRPYRQHRQQASPPQAQQPHTAATSHQLHQTPAIQHKRARAHDATPAHPRDSKRARA